MTNSAPDPSDTAVFETSFEQANGLLSRNYRMGRTTFRSTITNENFSADKLGDWWKAYLRGDRPQTESQGAEKTIRSLELFCGSGGLALGFDQACDELGVRAMSVGAIDQDAEAVAVYQANHRTGVASTDSVSMLVDYQVLGNRESARFHYAPELVAPGWTDLVGRVDIVLAGPPCQGHSNLNNRTRRNDRRNDLYLTVPAVAVAVGAPMIVIENVPAVVHDDAGVVASTRTLLESAGYFVETGVLNAAELGWPQNRNRFFLVASRNQPPIPLGTISKILESKTRPISWALEGLEDSPIDDFMFGRPELSQENRERIDWLFENDAYDLPNSERPECHRDGTTYKSVYGRLYPDKPCPTITTGFMSPGRGRYIHPTRRRVLTPREAARIQGFPDTYNFHPDSITLPNRSKLEKWIGDAVPMPLGQAASLSLLLPRLALS